MAAETTTPLLGVGPFRRRRTVSGIAAGGVLVLFMLVVGREVVLRSLGKMLVVNDPVDRADIAIMTTQDPRAAVVELADLFHAHVVDRVGVLVPQSSSADREFIRRGVRLPEWPDVLQQLGVPADLIDAIP